MIANINYQSQFNIDETLIEKSLNEICKFLVSKKAMTTGEQNLTVEIVFSNKEQVRALNHQFRKMDKPTDILSFAPIEADSIGELIFCNEILVDQAKGNKHTPEDEFKYLLAHGILHLLGYDHEDKDEAKQMFALQDEVFELIRS